LPVFGDQLSPRLASLAGGDKAEDVVLICEVADEMTYVRHHKKKIALILSAMRHFAAELHKDGWTVDYVTLDDPENSGSFTGEVGRAADRHGSSQVTVTEPGEWRVQAMIDGWADAFGVPVDVLPDDRFLCSRADLAAWADGRKQLRMEHFYRDMRRKTGFLMDGDKPAGGKWNFDADNRKRAPENLDVPEPWRTTPDNATKSVIDLVADRFSDHFGDLEPFGYAVTHADAESALTRFIDEGLPQFGDYQDAMVAGERYLFHSAIDAYLNIGLLDPRDACRQAEAAYERGAAPLNAVEGFIRQIIGWREYVRGIYWLKMPGYTAVNHFGHTAPLPTFYWTGDTDMACVRAVVEQTAEEAYAHHIQRLMVTGNFALLAGVDPAAVHKWYLGVYADAFEWVELPNTIGMSQFADGGLLASKPYVSSGNYINRMSDYCRGCAYNVRLRSEENACPFNALYWRFLEQHRVDLGGNPRMAPMYRTWDRFDDGDQAAILARGGSLVETLRSGGRI
jgi:deoxyribodipyrimidine photolyase-related protein